MRGEAHHKAKLTNAEVRAHRARSATGGVTMQALAAENDVSRPSVSVIVRRKEPPEG